MKKTIIFVCALLATITTNAQTKNNVCGKIRYPYIRKTDLKVHARDEMVFNNTISYSKEMGVKKIESEKTKTESDEGVTTEITVGRKNLTPEFFYNTKKEFYFSEIFLDALLIVKEDPFHWKWKLHTETKKLGKFICQKAIIKFRGRNFTAWFTNEIPVPFGHWKLKGLPGLILEAYNADKTFHVIANNVEITENPDCSISFDKKQIVKALSIFEYLKEIDRLIDEDLARMSAKLPKGTPPLKRAKDCQDCSDGFEIFNEEK